MHLIETYNNYSNKYENQAFIKQHMQIHNLLSTLTYNMTILNVKKSTDPVATYIETHCLLVTHSLLVDIVYKTLKMTLITLLNV